LCQHSPCQLLRIPFPSPILITLAGLVTLRPPGSQFAWPHRAEHVPTQAHWLSPVSSPYLPRPVPSPRRWDTSKTTRSRTCVKTASTLDTVVFVVLRERDKDRQYKYTPHVSPLSSPPPQRPHALPHRRRLAAMLEGVDETRFTSLELARPTMTSLPHPLLHLSHQMLDWLEPHVGSREAATSLWKGGRSGPRGCRSPRARGRA
jgi:hypothetical protein